jgi:two-component system LytT family response regulator
LKLADPGLSSVGRPVGSPREAIALFAIRAFDAEALDYLVKPVGESRFNATVARLVRRLGAVERRHEARIVATTSRGSMVTPVRDIDWIEAAGNYSRIWTGGRSCLLRESLRQLEARVRGHGFVRTHRRALIRLRNLHEVKWTRAGEMVAVLTNSVTVPVSRRRRAAFAAARQVAHRSASPQTRRTVDGDLLPGRGPTCCEAERRPVNTRPHR